MFKDYIISKDINGNKYQVAVSDLKWRPSVYGIVIKNKKILLVKAYDKYHLPGGGVHIAEDPAIAVMREVKEETGINVSKPTLLDIDSSYFTFKLNKQQGLKHVQSLMIYYACDYVGGNFSESNLDEYEAEAKLSCEWIDINKLNKIAVGTTVDWRPIVNKFYKE